jgi:RNA-directed DNA polymerase
MVKLASKRWNIEQLAGWTRRHMRKCFWQRWHNKKGAPSELSAA